MDLTLVQVVRLERLVEGGLASIQVKFVGFDFFLDGDDGVRLLLLGEVVHLVTADELLGLGQNLIAIGHFLIHCLQELTLYFGVVHRELSVLGHLEHIG